MLAAVFSGVSFIGCAGIANAQTTIGYGVVVEWKTNTVVQSNIPANGLASPLRISVTQAPRNSETTVTLACSGEGAIASRLKPEDSQFLSTDLRAFHEQPMQEAIKQSRRNPLYPLGAVISNCTTGKILSRGVNMSSTNPIFDGEVVAINDYVAQYGNHGWTDTTLYTTGEPCA